jgi:translocation and assembly module TamA
LDIDEKKGSFAGLKRKQAIKNAVLDATQPYGYYKPSTLIAGNRLTISLGPPVYIHQIQLTINGPGRYIYSRMRQKLPIDVNDIFNTENYNKTKQMLYDIAEQHGYLRSTMEISEALVDLKSMQVNITIRFDTGPLFHFGTIHFSPTPYDEAFLRRYLNFSSQENYSTEKLLKLNDNLNGSGYFRKVHVNPHIGKALSVPIDIRLKAKPSQYYTFGGGYGTDTGVRGRVGVNFLRVTRQGHTFQALLQGSQKQNALQAAYHIPGRDPVREQFAFNGNIFELRYPVGKSRGALFNAGYLYHSDKTRYTFMLNALNEEYTYTGQQKQSAFYLYPALRILTRKVSHPLFSKSGFNIEFKGQGATKDIKANEDYLQGVWNGKAAIWLPTHTRLFGRVTLGATKVANLFQVPLSLQLLAGGSDTIRGYSYQSIGPGRKEIVYSGEVQQEVYHNWFITGFYDRGDVYDPTPLQYKNAVGAGLMWVSPVGPIRVSFARALDLADKPFKLVINMGPDL